MAFGIRDIARLAGTSPATVSRILNNPDYHCSSEELRQRILDIAAGENYHPNENAKHLRQNKLFQTNKKQICFLKARISSGHPDKDPFFSSLARALEQETISQGASLGISCDISQIDPLLSLSPPGNRVGLVVLGRPEDQSSIHVLQNHFSHIVFIGLQRFDAPVNQVITDAREATSKALQYFLSLGHRRIGYIGETIKEQRYDGYLEFLQQNHLDYGTKFVANCIYHGYDNGYQATLELMSRLEKPTAVFCANDLTAFGAITALYTLGYHVPNDISLISIDNIELAQFTTPMLTTVQIPLKEISYYAIKLLINEMDEEITSPLTIRLPCSLVVRESCRKL